MTFPRGLAAALLLTSLLLGHTSLRAADSCFSPSFGDASTCSCEQDEDLTWLRRFADRAVGSGIQLEVDVISDSSVLVEGGAEEGSGAFRTLIDGRLLFDLDRILPGRWPGGRIVAGFQTFLGEDGNADVGDLIVYSNIDNPFNFEQLSALYYEQTFYEEDLRLIIGKYDANELFNASDISGDFLNSAMGNQPTTFQVLPTYPDPSLSFNIQGQLTDKVSAAIGFYDGRLADGINTGLAGLGFRDPFIIGQVDIALADDGLSRFSLGGWTHTFNDFELLNGTGVQNGQQGWFANLDLLLWTDGDRSLEVFGSYGQADAAVNPIPESLTLGLVGRGWWGERPDDSFGIGAVWAELSDLDPSTDQDAETQLESYYQIVLNDHWFIQPTTTVVFDTAGDTTIGDAVVLSMRIGYSR